GHVDANGNHVGPVRGGGVGAAALLQVFEIHGGDAFRDLFGSGSAAAHPQRAAATRIGTDGPVHVPEPGEDDRGGWRELVIHGVVAARQAGETHRGRGDTRGLYEKGLAGIAQQQQVVRAEDLRRIVDLVRIQGY